MALCHCLISTDNWIFEFSVEINNGYDLMDTADLQEKSPGNEVELWELIFTKMILTSNISLPNYATKHHHNGQDLDARGSGLHVSFLRVSSRINTCSRLSV